ncbi:kinase-like domain-containing protein [Cerioporus squamosus]|nr:kinase-like domain-containing protein [Cerioporus squamosus]
MDNTEEPGALTEGETYWRERYEWLKRTGYTLRPRYDPKWEPSWKRTGKSRFQSEDGIRVMTSKVLDAVRTNDGQLVVIKHDSKSIHPFESDIALFLSSPPLSTDPRNHCVPILEVIDDPYDADRRLMVMPLLRTYDDPKFATVGEAVEFFRQAFEGVQFMHEHHVAHRDISRLNVMMDSKPILPEMFHPQRPWRMLDGRTQVRPYTRTARPVKYYFVDFGLSRRYIPEETNPLELPIIGGDKTVPEFQDDYETPRNPFHTDVYYMGNLIRRFFCEVYTNFKFMEPLIARMVQEEPSKRPTMDEVVSEFAAIRAKLSCWKLRERLVERRDSVVMNVIKDVHHISTRALPNLLSFRKPIPTPSP